MSNQDSLVFKDLSGFKCEAYICTGYNQLSSSLSGNPKGWGGTGKRQLEASHMTQGPTVSSQCELEGFPKRINFTEVSVLEDLTLMVTSTPSWPFLVVKIPLKHLVTYGEKNSICKLSGITK